MRVSMVELGSTDIKNLLVSYEKYVHHLENRVDSKEMMLGRAFHAYVLRGKEVFEREFTTSEFLTQNKSWKIEQESSDKDVLLKEQSDILMSMLKASGKYRTLFPTHKTEGCVVETVHRLPLDNGVALRATPDALITKEDGTLTMVDLKTYSLFGGGGLTNGDRESIEKFVYSRKYHIQLGMYKHVIEATLKKRVRRVGIVAIGTAPPHNISAFDIDDDFLALGLHKTMEAVSRYGEYQRSHGKTPVEMLTMHEIKPKPWMLAQSGIAVEDYDPAPITTENLTEALYGQNECTKPPRDGE